MLPYTVARDYKGLFTIKWNQPENGNMEPWVQYLSDTECRTMAFSSDGSKFAWCDAEGVHILDTATQKQILALDLPRTFILKFSPNGDILCTWEHFSVMRENPMGKENLRIFDAATGEMIFSVIQKNMNGWLPQWISGTNICGKLLGSNVLFYADNKFDNVIDKLHIDKLDKFEVSPNTKPPHHVACFIRGTKAAPSSVRIFKYGSFSPEAIVANKSFFKADQVEILWNKRGTELIAKCLVEADTTGESYYGEQSLHFVATNGETAIVSLSKKGPIYDAAWSPNSNEFCVVYGFMPAKAGIFNLKCDQIFEFSPSPKNECHFNPHGNILVLAGFGNLRGTIEVWDIEKRKQVSQFQSPDTTHFAWSDDGAHFITATTTPRLRVGNGYKLWHYLRGMCHQTNLDHSLFEMLWQPSSQYPMPNEHVKQGSAVVFKPKEGPKAYIPPHARGNAGYLAKLKLEDDDDDGDKPMSKAAMKNKKKRNANRRPDAPNSNLSNEQNDAVQMAKYLLSENGNAPSNNNWRAPAPPVDENEKKIKTLRKKLQAIDKLKVQQSEGKTLEKNQIEKLQSEEKLLQELQQLTAN